ncbi:MAG TPA: hypothetical protein EYQ81_07140, partial [Sneathiellales bacterium]|nr:hypothetical protein [Sneathiellales bacterium]
MPANIIEANTTPFDIVDVDPITLDLIENGLRNARFEMDAVLFRTAMSPGIREQHDEFPIIANRDGYRVERFWPKKKTEYCFFEWIYFS